ncbi:WUSCHEL-related homeobox 9-like [Vigna radiata var. radiata]|uniref:WUSCHEL-related homeobox 9-like n=1 Tax=Vigna radiata var. radiata TaxID=3916 RepID=A0A1S3UK30_VIGRR|nr:WUSCHEL-related homeobox 9-like [Vigna radiata var. radiata]XP_022640191.1 WUSCHEL-related homeobox 9-like [Vigna radiata var. radiata]
MSSSNKHWPSMFKSKPCNSHNQWQHGNNSSVLSTGCQRSPYTPGNEEKTPEPKSRWNPKPEQIRILEAIFNSGMVNPPRDEIRKIRVQLQEYGQVGDANVFYWFQNRKSRSKNKLRHIQNSKNHNTETQANLLSLSQIIPPSTSSSSSDKSSSKELVHPNAISFGFSNVNDALPNSPTASVNQTYLQSHNYNNTALLPPVIESFSFPLHNNGQGVIVNDTITTHGFSIPQFSNNIMQSQPQCEPKVGHSSSLFLNEIMSHGTFSKKDQDQEKALKSMHRQQLSSPPTSSSTTTVAHEISTLPCPITQLQGVGGEVTADREKCIVFINDVAFEVMMGPFNVRQAFGDEAVLIHSSGPVPTDDWGITLHPLQHGAYYYLI